MSTLQRKGGAINTKRIREQVDSKKGGYSEEALLENNPESVKALSIYDEALEEGRVLYLHSQTFLNQSGSTRTTIGNGSGIQLNLWFSKNVTWDIMLSEISIL